MSLQVFHKQITDLLKLVGFDDLPLLSDQEVFSLDVDELFTMHCLLANPETWVILAELPAPLPEEKYIHEAMLHINQPIGTTWQPIIGLNDKNHPIVWLNLPLYGLEPAASLEAFQTVTDSAKALHTDFLTHDEFNWHEINSF